MSFFLRSLRDLRVPLGLPQGSQQLESYYDFCQSFNLPASAVRSSVSRNGRRMQEGLKRMMERLVAGQL